MSAVHISEQPEVANWFLFPILQFGKPLISPSTSSSLTLINNIGAGLFVNMEIGLLHQPLSSWLPFGTVKNPAAKAARFYNLDGACTLKFKGA